MFDILKDVVALQISGFRCGELEVQKIMTLWIRRKDLTENLTACLLRLQLLLTVRQNALDLLVQCTK